jgi:hypothetical protein
MPEGQNTTQTCSIHYYIISNMVLSGRNTQFTASYNYLPNAYYSATLLTANKPSVTRFCPAHAQLLPSFCCLCTSLEMDRPKEFRPTRTAGIGLTVTPEGPHTVILRVQLSLGMATTPRVQQNSL